MPSKIVPSLSRDAHILTNAIRCSALLFDMDGVLINSTQVAARVWSAWAVEHGFDPEIVVSMAHGRPSRTTIRDLMPNCDVEREDREVQRREMEDVEGVVLLPGARELLDSLPPDRWTIATSCTRPLAEVRLRAAGLPIPTKLVTSSDVKIGKPDPEPYLKAAEKLGFAACRLYRGRRCSRGSSCRQSRRSKGNRISHHFAASRSRSSARRLDCKKLC